MLSVEAQDFIRSSPFLFIASRAWSGHIDVSPRGDDPAVLRIESADTLTLPDRAGNNRLDTVSNMLDRPDVCLAVTVRGSDRFLRIRAKVAISVAPEDLKPFEIRGLLPMSVARLTVRSADFIETRAFADAQFWSPPKDNLAPLPLFPMLKEQLAYHTSQGVPSAEQQPPARPVLERAGLSEAYQLPSHYVIKKSFPAFDLHSTEFIRNCRFAALAFTDETGELDFVMSGGEAGFAVAQDARHILMKGEARARVTGGVMGGLFVRPGMPETLRLNGAVNGSESTFETREMFLHCSNSFIRSRIWRPEKRLAWLGEREFVCRERVVEAKDVASFLLAPVDDAPLEPFHPGQYVAVMGPQGEGRRLQRCYSLSNAPSDNHFRITVKRHDKGGLSDWLHDHVVAGTMLELGAPRGRFRLDEKSQRPVALVSAGVGITPIISMLRSLKTTPQRPVWFIHGARNGRAHVMGEHVRQLAQSGMALRTHFVYSQPDRDDVPGRDYDQQGRIDIATLTALLDPRATDFYLCGPNDFMMALKDGLMERGVRKEQIRMEIFGAGDSRPGAVAGPPAMVTFTRSGLTAKWTPADGPLLDFALRQKLDAPYVCRQGDCQSCAQKLVSGTVAYPADLDIEPTEGHALLCQAVPMGDVSIDL